jgi:hypothetical protein
MYMYHFFASQELIEQVKAYGGRFLGKCNDGSWYVMNTEDARKRAIQGERLNNN